MSDELPFDPPDGPVAQDELERIARAVGREPRLWQDGLRQTTAERTYADVFTNEHLGVWAISWMADGHDTGYHDHDVSAGAVYVVRGAIRHEHLRLGERPVGRAVPAGESYTFDNTFIHRMRREPDAGPTVTVHAYSPPLEKRGSTRNGMTTDCFTEPRVPPRTNSSRTAIKGPPADRRRSSAPTAGRWTPDRIRSAPGDRCRRPGFSCVRCCAAPSHRGRTR